tara:strand:- start:6839 stop:6988 length:150 start_codon:yes stop_codon:yes gene_type:complete
MSTKKGRVIHRQKYKKVSKVTVPHAQIPCVYTGNFKIGIAKDSGPVGKN